MFQDFTVKADPKTVAPRLKALRALMSAENLDVLLVPHADEYQNEYIPAQAERLAFLTGFTGSAGEALVMQDRAILFVDGRYTIQAAGQTDRNCFAIGDLVNDPPVSFLARELQPGMRVGFDPWLLTVAQARRLEAVCEKTGAVAVATEANLVDRIWTDRPAEPDAPLVLHPVARAGLAAARKLAVIARDLRAARASAVVITDPSSIAWVLNIRGSDVAHTPLALARMVIPARGKPTLFAGGNKLDAATRAALERDVVIAAPESFEDAVAGLASSGKPVMLDPDRAPALVGALVADAGAAIIEARDPVIAPRAAKNPVELKGAAEAHRRDGAAMAAFLCWYDEQDAAALDEITIVRKLEAIRRATGERLGMPLRDISFDTICGAGPNGAINHYRVDEKTNRKVRDGDLVLVDSGGQYEDGTTDITRVLPAGSVPDEFRRHFTLVLKGMIAITVARFPAGTRGMDIDVLARRALWEAGFDYAHGTGHGVGSYLGVHEGPQSISKRGQAVLKTGMILSNEPGLYVEGSHGIRIENLIVVAPPKPVPGGMMPMHAFRTLTLCPIDRRLVDRKLLTPAERRWLNAYHARVRREITPLVESEKVARWLEQATARI